ncbi:MAG: hypothetical protein HUJ87_14225 [Fusobacterium varium]|jgi:hypothetical protein|uniref:hypothetical protein n=1 Tax=Fusobacterium varium TaxID=856 RepID=UPI00189A4119|nr:hypothetical protein [Fusobacterium varium]MCF0171647.1 hypothetical protein [Fusobacterium varium]
MMGTFKNLKITGQVDGINSKLDISLEVAGFPALIYAKGQEVPYLFKEENGKILPDKKLIIEKIKGKIIASNAKTKEKVNEILEIILKEITEAYKQIVPEEALNIMIEEFGIEDKIPEKENEKINFFEKVFDIDLLPIENNSFTGKVKAFLKRYQENRYMDSVYIYNETSPEKETDQAKYDLFGINYMILDRDTGEEKTIYNTMPVPLLSELFKITPLELFQFSNESISKEEYKRQISR